MRILFATTAGNIISHSIAPTVTAIALIASILCTIFLIIGGWQYITSKGDPEKLSRAKRIIKNALVGLIIVLAAGIISSFLKSAYGPVYHVKNTNVVPNLKSIKPSKSGGIISVVIKVISGIFSSVIETVAIPFLKALTYFTSGTPLAAANHSVFDLWVSAVGIADSLLVIVIMLIGLHTMGYISLGLESIDIKQIIPKVGFAFLLINSSIFLIDTVISLSNAMIKAIGGQNAAHSVWKVLEQVVKQPSAYGLAALIIMVIFLVFSVILLIFYVGRIVVIYLGAVLAPLVILCWLLPSLRDMAISASKRYFSSIFVLFIHVVILELAASILSGMISSNGSKPDPLMSMIVGLATLIALIKTQGVMSQLSYASIGPRMTRKIGQRLVINASYLGSQATSFVNSFIPGRQNSAIANYRDYSYRQLGTISSNSGSNPANKRVNDVKERSNKKI